MSFSADVGKWASQSVQRLTAVRRRSVELLADEMTRTVNEGGRVPFQTGNLYKSLLASTEGMPQVGDPPFTAVDVGITTATLELNQPVWLGYQARYSRRVNYGFIGADSLGRTYNQPGYYFVDHAIAGWQSIVTAAVEELRS